MELDGLIESVRGCYKKQTVHIIAHGPYFSCYVFRTLLVDILGCRELRRVGLERHLHATLRLLPTTSVPPQSPARPPPCRRAPTYHRPFLFLSASMVNILRSGKNARKRIWVKALATHCRVIENDWLALATISAAIDHFDHWTVLSFSLL